MRTGKESAVNGAKRNPSTAKLHELSCKIAPRDSSFIATKDSCNQTQADPPTRSPSRMLHRKTAFTEVFFIHGRHLATDPFSKHNPTNRSSLNRNQQTKKKSLGQRDLNTRVGELFRKGECPYQKDLYPYLSSRSLSNLLTSIEWTMHYSQRGGMAPQWTPSTPSWLATSSPTFPSLSVLVHYAVHFTGKFKIIPKSD